MTARPSAPRPVLTRRALLSAAAAGLAAPVLAQVPVPSSPLPRPRPSGLGRIDITAMAERLIADTRLGGQAGFALADARTGALLAASRPDLPMAPASTAKALTAAYALDNLGPAHRFSTALLATGPLRQGRIEGDLILAGGGDPALDSAGLWHLLDQLAAAGIRAITGRFLVWAGALPFVQEIDPGQPDHLGYNPSVAGLNLNYNRVHFQWRRAGADYALTMDARAGTLVPPVGRVRMRAENREAPIYTFRRDPATGAEDWTVARPALGEAGSRWLPVRDPARYAGEVLRSLALSRMPELALPDPVLLQGPLPPAVPVAVLLSEPLGDIIRGMLRYSTNLTAEVLGLAATAARRGAPATLAESAAEMNAWAATALGMRTPALIDHSGLGAASRVTPMDMVRAMVTLGPAGPLYPLMRETGLKSASGAPEPFTIHAKTGTLNFVSCLAGYVARPRGAPLAFAIMTADHDRRDAIPPGDEENPAGGSAWASRSRAMQYDLVRLMARA